MRFPLFLSCGHNAADQCACHAEPKYKKNGDSPIDQVFREFNGKWRETLESYGAQLPSGRNHGPCPVCSGRDRFRFDDKDGRGTWFCSQCEPQAGGGLLLLSRYINKPVIETAKELLGDNYTRTVAPVRTPIINYDAIRALNIEQAKKSAQLLMSSAIFQDHPYTDKKGLNGDYTCNGQDMMSTSGIIKAGDLLLVPVYKKGELVNVQKISADGTKRPLTGGDMQGVYHKLDGKTALIAIVEGYATGLTVHQMTGATTYCAFNTGNLAEVGRFARSEHPDSRIVFFADHDNLDPVHKLRPGTKYAEDAAIIVNGIVALPPQLGDWDDYRQTHGVESCKQAMRDAIANDLNRGVAPAPVKAAPTPKPPAPAETAPKRHIITTPEHGLPHGISFDDYDIDQPPHLAGEIVKYIKDGANRILTGGAYAVVALQCMAAAGAGLEGVNGSKLSLMSITLGLTAGGKERPQKVAKQLMSSNGRAMYGDIRSDKDVIRSVINDNGRSFYIVDEAQKIFGAASKANKHMSNVESALMEIATSSSFNLSPLHQEEFSAAIELKKVRYEKMRAAKVAEREQCNPDLDQAKIKAIDLSVTHYQNLIDDADAKLLSIVNGIPNPALNIICSSTPQKLAEIVNEDSIESGFLGRAIICDCGSERTELVSAGKDFSIGGMDTKKIDPELVRLQTQIGLICQMADDFKFGDINSAFSGDDFGYTATPGAIDALTMIINHYEQFHFRNHVRLGGLYARLFERVQSLSSVMALGNIVNGQAVIERDFVVYALMMTLNSIENLASNLRVNEGASAGTIEAKLEAVKEAILKRLKVSKADKLEGWRYKSEIKANLKLRKFYQEIQKECQKESQDAFENAVAMLGNAIERSSDGKKIRIR